ncbi:unnamed protein product [Prorocentrum cordatum]|uniref:C2 domain-containing protein n=1 Tax=Prorocentrum cordatum TaxID=2364126 RepID=A0ABN9QBU2_9DINO|nr:unnamed protein product [Polarella glacialis]
MSLLPPGRSSRWQSFIPYIRRNTSFGSDTSGHGQHGGITKLLKYQKRFPTYWLQGSMTNTVLVLYRIYFVFVSLIIGLAFGMNLLMAWFIEWLQDLINLRDFYERQGGSYDYARLVIFFAVVSRCYVLIRLLSYLTCSATHFLYDMLGAAEFQLYRCCLTGKAAVVMDQATVPDSTSAFQACREADQIGVDRAPSDGQAPAAVMSRVDLQTTARAEKHLKMEPLWRLDFQMTWNTAWRWWLDLAVQAIIHLSLDVGPFAIVLWHALVRQRPANQVMRLCFGRGFSLYACWATTSHIVIFHIAWTLNDYVAKWWAFRRLWKTACERERAWGMYGVGGEDDPRQVSVTLVSATGLRAADSDGLSDPYCVCRIRGKSGYEFQTEPEPMELNPRWEHCQSMPVLVRGSTLEFEVWDHDILSADDILGTATLKLSSAECDLSEVVTTDLELGGHPEAQGSLRRSQKGNAA